ncbi:unnamed protein product [Closterium sp. NIES-54]
MRNVLDPKRHYRSADSKKLPTHFQIGTVVEGAADFYSSRLTRRERKQSFAAELLHDEDLKKYRCVKIAGRWLMVPVLGARELLVGRDGTGRTG